MLPAGRRRGWTEWTVLGVATAVAALAFLSAHRHQAPHAAPRPGDPGMPFAVPPPGFGWWSNWDQWHYIQAALAWADGKLDPAWHWYLPLYPLLGAPFVAITPLDPFLLPDLACLLAALWLFAAIAARLLPDVPGARAIGAGLFLAATVLPRAALHVWVEPWTTIPQTVGMYGALLAGLRFLARPRGADAFLAAFACTALIGFRPADGAVIDAVGLLVVVPALLARRPGWRALAAFAGAAGAGAAIPLAAAAAGYLAVFGASVGPYSGSPRGSGSNGGCCRSAGCC